MISYLTMKLQHLKINLNFNNSTAKLGTKSDWLNGDHRFWKRFKLTDMAIYLKWKISRLDLKEAHGTHDRTGWPSSISSSQEKSSWDWMNKCNRKPARQRLLLNDRDIRFKRFNYKMLRFEFDRNPVMKKKTQLFNSIDKEIK